MGYAHWHLLIPPTPVGDLLEEAHQLALAQWDAALRSSTGKPSPFAPITLARTRGSIVAPVSPFPQPITRIPGAAHDRMRTT